MPFSLPELTNVLNSTPITESPKAMKFAIFKQALIKERILQALPSNLMRYMRTTDVKSPIAVGQITIVDISLIKLMTFRTFQYFCLLLLFGRFWDVWGR